MRTLYRGEGVAALARRAAALVEAEQALDFIPLTGAWSINTMQTSCSVGRQVT
jgi:hypothetical protein